MYRRRGIEVVTAPCSGTRLRPVQLVEASGMGSAAQCGLAVWMLGRGGGFTWCPRSSDVDGRAACSIQGGVFGLGALKFI